MKNLFLFYSKIFFYSSICLFSFGGCEKYSGKILARSANNITLEGREMVRVALAEFPDIETAKNCYNSEEYVEARKHLENNVIREHIIFEKM